MYESYFGLTASPFQLNPDPAFLYLSKGHRSAHDYLRQGVARGDGIAVVTGEIGAGKTTLIGVALDEIDPAKIVAAQLVSTQLDAHDLLRAVAIAFGLSSRAVGRAASGAAAAPANGVGGAVGVGGAAAAGARGATAGNGKSPPAGDGAAPGEDAELLARIEAFLVGLALDGRRAILVVDEAQNLATEAIEVLLRLSDLHSGHHPLLHCLLAGQPELRELLRTPSMERLGQRVDAAFHLGPLDREETRAYIEHRLHHVGWKDDPTFDPDVFAVIHRETDGIPRRINTLCNRLLLGASLEDKHRISATAANEAAAELRLEIDYDERPGTRAAINPARKGPAPAPTHAAGHAVTESALSARLDRLERSIEVMARLVEKIG